MGAWEFIAGQLRSPSGAFGRRLMPGFFNRGDSRVTDLHLWSIAPGVFAAELVVVSADPLTPDAYKARLPAGLGLGHVAVEVHRR